MSAACEQELKKLSMLPENKICVCGTESRFGHGSLCMPFKIFVCGHCKAGLQAFSFRVKSLTMSNFVPEEVESFRSRNGGGNDHCRRTYLAKLPVESSLRPREGDHPDKYKMFVQSIFINKDFFSEEGVTAVYTAGGVTSSGAGGAASLPTPALDLAGVKGRWGPQAAVSSNSGARTDSLGRKVASGWDDQPEEKAHPDDGIKIREGHGSANSSLLDTSHHSDAGTDLLGFGAGGAGISKASHTSAASDDFLFGGAAATPAPAAAAAGPLSGAAILGAYSQPAHPGPRPMMGGGSMGFGGARPMGMAMGGGMPMGGMGAAPSMGGGFGATPAMQPSFGFLSSPQVSQPVAMMAPQQPVLGSGGGGLNAVLAGLNQPAPANTTQNAASTAAVGSKPSGAGLDSLLSNFSLNTASSSSSTGQTKAATSVPLAKLTSTTTPAAASVMAPNTAAPSAVLSGFGAGGMSGDPFASIMPPSQGMPQPMMPQQMQMPPRGMQMQMPGMMGPRPTAMHPQMGGMMAGFAGAPRPAMGMALGGAIPMPKPQTASFTPGDPFFGI